MTAVDAMNHTVTTTLDADGEKTAVTDNLNHTTQYVLGHLGELLTTIDALSHSSSDKYDSRFRLVQTTAADGGVTQIALDPAGNRVALVDPANNRTTWTVDQINRPVTETNSSGTVTTAYDPASEITSIQDAEGRVRDFTHDNLHRLTAEDWMSGSTIVAAMNYGYDAASQLVSASDANSAYAFGYDNDGNVLSVDNNGTPGVPEVLLKSAFDTMGDRTSLAATIAGTADLLNSYTYDADQRLTMLQQQGQSGGNAVSSKEVDLAYNALGQFTTIADFNYLNGGPRMDIATGVYSYDTGNRLTGLAYTSNAGANQIDTFGWGYDAANNVTSFSTNSGTATYGNDLTNQLTSASYTGTNQPTNEAYSFDKNGNRTNTGYTTGPNNLLTSDGTFNYQHDADGNQTVRTRISSAYASDYETTFASDYRNRLTDVEYFDNNGVLTKHVHYVYGVFDHLLATEVDTTGGGSYNEVEHYVLDVSPEIPSAGVPGMALAQPLLQFDGSGNPTIRYLEALNQIFAEGDISSLTQGDVPDFMLSDNLGTVRYAVDQSGTVVDKIEYNSFGQVSYESNPAIHHFGGYTGGHIDVGTGFILDYHRWYNPVTGRWMSQDPSGFSAGDADLNRYLGNAPAGGTDATGLQGSGGTGGQPGGPTYPPQIVMPGPGADPYTGPPFITTPPTPITLPSGPIYTPGYYFNITPPMYIPYTPWFIPPMMLSYSYGSTQLTTLMYANWLNQVNASSNFQFPTAQPQPTSIFDPDWWRNWPTSVTMPLPWNPNGTLRVAPWHTHIHVNPLGPFHHQPILTDPSGGGQLQLNY